MTDDTTIEVEKEKDIVQVESPRSVVVDPKSLQDYIKHEQEIRDILTKYIKEELKAGVDFGTIKISSKSGKEYQSKPTLLKPGSEKFCAIMHLRPTFKKDDDTWEMSGRQNGVFCYVCSLVNEKGQIVGEGRGAADLKEKSNWTANNAIKIAQKRAQVDAVIRTGQLSDFFTQDIEDMNLGVESHEEKMAEKATHQEKYGAPTQLNDSQKAFQTHYRNLTKIKTDTDLTQAKEAIQNDEKLSDKQKSYLRDLADKAYKTNAGGDIPF